jgi:hypothetical protein
MLFATVADKFTNDSTFDAAEAWGQTAASSLGISQEPRRGRKIDECDIIDKLAPALTGVVYSSHTSKFVPNLMNITIAVVSVDIPDGCPYVRRLPSGAVVQALATKVKSPTPDTKLSTPHVIANECGIYNISGFVDVSVRTDKAGRAGLPLTSEDIPMSSKVTLHGVVFHTHVKPEETKIYGAARAIDLPHGTTPRSAAEREQLFVTQLVTNCPGVLQESTRATLSFMGYKDSTEAHVELRSRFREDVTAVISMFRRMATDMKDHRVGLQTAWEQSVISSEASDSIEKALDALDGFLHGANDSHVLSLHSLLPFDASTSQHIPTIAIGTTPSVLRALKTPDTGLGYITNVIRAEPSMISPDVHTVPDALLRPSAKTYERTDDQKRGQSIGAFSMDVSSFAVNVRTDGGEWAVMLPKLDDGPSMVPRKFTISQRVGFLAGQSGFGVYDYYRTQMCFVELTAAASIMFFPTDNPTAKNACPTDRQPVVDDSEWGHGNREPYNYFGVPAAVKRAGVRISLDFIKTHATDEGGVVITKDKWQDIGQKNSNGGILPPDTPKLEINGYWAVNGVPDANFVSKISRAASPTDDVEFYAVYEGCGNDVAETAALNEDAVAGSEHVKLKFTGNVPLQDRIKNDVVVYAILVSKKKGPHVGEKRAIESTN